MIEVSYDSDQKSHFYQQFDLSNKVIALPQVKAARGTVQKERLVTIQRDLEPEAPPVYTKSEYKLIPLEQRLDLAPETVTYRDLAEIVNLSKSVDNPAATYKGLPEKLPSTNPKTLERNASLPSVSKMIPQPYWTRDKGDNSPYKLWKAK